MDLLDTPNATASTDGVVGTLIPAPSPRRSAQSPATHQLQQTLRNNATEQVLRYDSASPTNSNNSGNATSAFSTFGVNNHPIMVETVKENSDDGDEWPEGNGLVGNNAEDNVQVNSAPSASKADGETGIAYDSTTANGVDSASSHAVGNLVINTSDPGRGDFVISVGALGNASGTPLDGSHNFSFGERTVVKQDAVDGDKQPKECKGMLVCSGSESSGSCNTPTGFDPSDPEAIGDLLARPPKTSPRSPSAMQFNEQTVVTECTQGGDASTTIGNLGGATNTRPSSSLPGSAALRQHTLAGGTSNSGGSGPNNNSASGSSNGGGTSPNGNPNGDPNGNPSGNPNPGNSDGNNNGGDQGRTSGGIDPQGPGPDQRDLSKIVLEHQTRGGPLEHWGMQGTIPVEEFVRIAGVRDPRAYEWVLQSKRQLMRPEIIDRVTDRMSFLCQHNDWNRMRAIVSGMTLIVRSVPNVKMEARNSCLLNDNQESTQAMCHTIGRHLAFARTLPPEQPPCRVPLLFFSEQMHAHPHHAPGSFNCVKKVDDAGAVVIPCGEDDDGNQIVDPPVTQAPAVPVPTAVPAPATMPGSTPGAGTESSPDPSAALPQGALSAMQHMTQVHEQSDRRNASMSQQQAKLQAAAFQSQAQLLKNLTRNLGNLGHDVGRAIASHPTQHSHALRAALSHPNAAVGQSNDPEVLGSLTRAIPIGMSVESFDCGPCIQAFQPQPNDKNTRRI